MCLCETMQALLRACACVDTGLSLWRRRVLLSHHRAVSTACGRLLASVVRARLSRWWVGHRSLPSKCKYCTTVTPSMITACNLGPVCIHRHPDPLHLHHAPLFWQINFRLETNVLRQGENTYREVTSARWQSTAKPVKCWCAPRHGSQLAAGDSVCVCVAESRFLLTGEVTSSAGVVAETACLHPVRRLPAERASSPCFRAHCSRCGRRCHGSVMRVHSVTTCSVCACARQSCRCSSAAVGASKSSTRGQAGCCPE